MRSVKRTIDRDLVRDVGLVCAAVSLVGVSFGAIAASSGLPAWLPVLLSIVVFAGASQFVFVGIIASGGSILAAVVAGLLVNARHVPFGFAVGDALGTGWIRRIAGTHLMVDESVAFALAQDDAGRRRKAYWACGAGIFVSWNVGVVAGVLGGTLVTDTDAFGLDAAFPAVLLALVLPSLRDRATRRAALAGAAIALATAPFSPAGLPVLLALAGVLAAFADGARSPGVRRSRAARGQRDGSGDAGDADGSGDAGATGNGNDADATDGNDYRDSSEAES
ncbi:branched-chain amino acid ABC transporter permease [Actinobacteria bacterium YIM 96077]|uniref:Branched-chain amino acid ABC transporter permease n=1 Tax=Phytoactinopolyspora halophila TaxID=1981511 RepID=A0A329QKF4_9ACTN|nr:AzlC family ABC transporter permease [Phytoactinopolyspora halophila]AYY13573.1 branched-chain amino acid ABC transporter permease [Actinobacteria bacterium YIM 96077]RAW12371.1 branched-chain amino acid ABC transporter permease [Phytoactinopolyspora halophila]